MVKNRSIQSNVNCFGKNTCISSVADTSTIINAAFSLKEKEPGKNNIRKLVSE